MKLLSKQNIPPLGGDETIFRISFWGTLFSFLFFLLSVLIGAALFIASWRASLLWGMILAALYTLMMAGFTAVILRTLRANRSASNWLARISSAGILLKYRSYLHDDSPGEDPIALQLAWAEIAGAQLQQEDYTTTDIDGKSRIRRWYLAIKLDPRYLDIDKVKAALEFESQRQPAHFQVDDLKHELFIARKNKASAGEINRIKDELAHAGKLHPGKQSKMKFCDRPIVFSSPDLLKMEWTHITPGRKKLRELLAHHTMVIAAQEADLDITKALTETEFKALLSTLRSRGDKIEAIKLVRLQMGLNLSDAKAFVEKAWQ